MRFLLNAWFGGFAAASTTLFNRAQPLVLDGAPQPCIDAFATELECDPLIHALGYDLVRLELTDANLQDLCKDACVSSLQVLEDAVSQGCGSWDRRFNGGRMSAMETVDFFRYKHEMFCLKEESSGSFCLTIEETWNLGELDRKGQATWPAHTKKKFPCMDECNTIWLRSADEEFFDEDEEWEAWDDSQPFPRFQTDGGVPGVSVSDFYIDPIPDDWMGHGWPEMLEYDEYPLGIQCSECFLAQYRTGMESRWGEMFDDVSAQVWENMRQNCNITWPLHPANNYSVFHNNSDIVNLRWTAAQPCPRRLPFPPDARERDWKSLARLLQLSSSALSTMNEDHWPGASEWTFCAPLPCDVDVVRETIGIGELAGRYDNFTLTQFVTWNPTLNEKTIFAGAVVCVGPPGGTYVPRTLNSR